MINNNVFILSSFFYDNKYKKEGFFVEYLDKMLKKTGYISILESIIFIILGGILIWKAETAIKIISIVLGLIFIIMGAGKVIGHFTINKKFVEFYNYELIYGLMAIVFGFIIIYYSSTIETILRIIVGIWIIYSSFVKLALSLKIKQVESKAWIYSIILSLIMFGCGIFIILNEGTIIATVGIIMIIYSIIDIVEDLICIKNIREIL